MTTWRHEKSKKAARQQAANASDAELAKHLKIFADDTEYDEGRARLREWLREAARRIKSTARHDEIEAAVTRHLLGYCMDAMASIVNVAPRVEPEGLTVETVEDAEAYGYDLAKWNDAAFVGISLSQISWLRKAAKAARSPGDVKRLADHLRNTGFAIPPPASMEECP